MLTKLTRVLFAMLIATCGSVAVADEMPPCPVPEGVTVRSFPDEVPGDILRMMTNDGKWEFAKPSEDFNSIDIFRPGLKNRRVIFVWERGRRWVVATERGGRRYNTPMMVFDQDPSTTSFRFSHLDAAGAIENVCRVATTLINSAD
jgi:hypothetical protein